MAMFKSLEGRNEPPDEKLERLQEKLSTLPGSIVGFGENIRSLYNVYQVTGQDEATLTFLEVRDNTRKNGIVYVDKVLPMTEEVVRKIGLFMNYFIDLDYEDWSDCLEDIISDITMAVGSCEILKQLHNTIIVDLKKNEDKAKVGMEMMNEMSKRYKEQAEQLNVEAKKSIKKAEIGRKVEMYVHIVTLGISKLLDYYYPPKIEAEKKAAMKTAGAVARQANADIASIAVGLTTTHLIPAVSQFIDSLEECSLFLNETKERLIEMKTYGDMGKRKVYYKMMQKHAGEVRENTKVFLNVTDKMRNNLAAIPTEVNDKNYVDRWFDKEMLKFKNEKKDVWNEIGTKWYENEILTGNQECLE